MKQVYVLLDEQDNILGVRKTADEAHALRKSFETEHSKFEVQRFIAVPQITSEMCRRIEQVIEDDGGRISIGELREITLGQA